MKELIAILIGLYISQLLIYCTFMVVDVDETIEFSQFNDSKTGKILGILYWQIPIVPVIVSFIIASKKLLKRISNNLNGEN